MQARLSLKRENTIMANQGTEITSPKHEGGLNGEDAAREEETRGNRGLYLA